MSDWRPLILAAAVAGCGPAAEEAKNVPRNAVEAAPQESRQAEGRQRPTVPSRESVFTSLDLTRCRLIEENQEEGGYSLRNCPGYAGWRLDWSESDLRQGLWLSAPGGRKTELRLSDLVAKGAFNRVGKTIEWRGRNAAKPEAMIVRMNVANGPEPGKPDISRLAVVRLTGTPCLVAVIEPGSGQNERARRIADGAMDKCLTD